MREPARRGSPWRAILLKKHIEFQLVWSMTSSDFEADGSATDPPIDQNTRVNFIYKTPCEINKSYPLEASYSIIFSVLATKIHVFWTPENWPKWQEQNSLKSRNFDITQTLVKPIQTQQQLNCWHLVKIKTINFTQVFNVFLKFTFSLIVTRFQPPQIALGTWFLDVAQTLLKPS